MFFKSSHIIKTFTKDFTKRFIYVKNNNNNKGLARSGQVEMVGISMGRDVSAGVFEPDESFVHFIKFSQEFMNILMNPSPSLKYYKIDITQPVHMFIRCRVL